MNMKLYYVVTSKINGYHRTLLYRCTPELNSAVLSTVTRSPLIVSGYPLELDRMSKFTYPRMRIRMRIPAREGSRMRIHMVIPVTRYPRTRMRIFVIILNNTLLQNGRWFLLQNTDYYRIQNTNYVT